MYMKQHILAALREEFSAWEGAIAGIPLHQRALPLTPSAWSLKDELAHLNAWQQRTIARLEAAQHQREPEFPPWLPHLDPEVEANTEPVNTWIYESNRDQSWETVYHRWRDGFLRMLELAQTIAEPALLDANRYPWLNGHSLAFIVIASYDHHQEHLEKLLRLQKSGRLL
ncbi:MAG: ClbS/DfsB family four-helix bundle protein [Anaerolineales bacterium]|nr:ClbS/DfsB family four-helix bundle protein [Anaerolineales bacterium]MCB8953657.1 ClbS/DfsB family four-helix bundle protein [Ardenticatenales bacterium]